ncbi:suppressor of glycerol defect, partial [Coemansia sp. S17]
LASAFYDEGLGELFDGISFGSKDVQQKSQDPVSSRERPTMPAREVDSEPESNQEPESDQEPASELGSESGSEADINDEAIGSDSDDDDDECDDDIEINSDDDDDDMFGLNDFGSEDGGDGSESEDSDIAEMYKSQGVDFNPELTGDYSDSDDDDDVSSVNSDDSDLDESTAKELDQSDTTSTRPAAPAADNTESSASKYIPPSLRRKLAEEAGQEDERVAAIRKALQGQLNRLSEANIDGIITQIEAQYSKYPRHHVNDVLTDLILQAIRSRIHMLDTFLYVNAALVGAVHRAVGLEPVAFLVQRLMEEFETFFKRGVSDAKGSSADKAHQPAGEAETLTPGKECQNLCVFLAELYNFQVIS